MQEYYYMEDQMRMTEIYQWHGMWIIPNTKIHVGT